MPIINRRLLPAKLHYFFFFGGMSGIFPYAQLIGTELGFSRSLVGYIYAAILTMALVARPIIAATADKLHKPKQMVITVAALFTLAGSSLTWIPPVTVTTLSQSPTSFRFECNSHTSLLRSCGSQPPSATVHPSGTTSNCQIDCDINYYISYGGKHLLHCADDDVILENDVINMDDITPPKKDDTRNNSISNDKLLMISDVMLNDDVIPSDDVMLKHDVISKSDVMPDDIIVNCDNAINRETKTVGFSAVVNTNPEPSQGCSYYSVLEMEVEGTGLNLSSICARPMGVECRVLVCDPVLVGAFAGAYMTEAALLGCYQLYWYLMAVFVLYLAQALIMNVCDGSIYLLLGDRTELFGLQHMWGTLGWGSLVLLSGLLMDYFTQKRNNGYTDFSPGIYIFVVCQIFNIAAILNIEFQAGKVEDQVDVLSGLKRTLGNVRILVFFLEVVGVGMATALMDTFLFMYMESFGATKFQSALARGVQCFGGEAIAFALSGFIIQKIGHMSCIAIAYAGFAIRYIGYYFVSSSLAILPLEILQGPCYGLFFSALTSYANKVAEPGLEITTQAIMTIAFLSLGPILGNLLGGYMVSVMEMREMFLYCGIASGVLCVCVFLLRGLFPCLPEQLCGGKSVSPAHSDEARAHIRQMFDDSVEEDNSVSGGHTNKCLVLPFVVLIPPTPYVNEGQLMHQLSPPEPNNNGSPTLQSNTSDSKSDLNNKTAYF